MTIADFNRRNIVSPGLLEEFAASGNPLIDRLWNKPAGSTKQRHRIAVGLYETLLAGNRFDPISLLHRAIRALPIDWDRYPFPYRHRRLRGRSAAWADAILALLIRMPLADVMDGSARHGQARSVIAACLRELLWATNVDGLDHDRYLASRMAMIVEVVEWYARHDPRAKKDIGIAMSPLMTYLWERRAGGLIPGAVRDAVDRLYLFLDGHLDICEDTQGAWPSIHEYCLKALGIPEQQSIVWRLQDDMPELVNGFRRSLSRRTGEEVAEILLSDREFDIAELCRGKDPVDTLLRLLRARALWQGVVGLGHENSYDVLHRALNRLPNWRGLNELIRDASAVDAPVRDAQMSELVRSLSDAGAMIAEQIVPRALSCVRTGGFPLTRQALEDLPAAEATAVVPFFDQTLRAVRQGLGRQ